MLKDINIGMKVALLLVLVIMAYMCAVTFFPLSDAGGEQAKTIVPFLLGVIATLVGFYWGNSHKENLIPSPVDDAIKVVAAKEETKRIKVADDMAKKVTEDAKTEVKPVLGEDRK